MYSWLKRNLNVATLSNVVDVAEHLLEIHFTKIHQKYGHLRFPVAHLTEIHFDTTNLLRRAVFYHQGNRILFAFFTIAVKNCIDSVSSELFP